MKILMTLGHLKKIYSCHCIAFIAQESGFQNNHVTLLELALGLPTASTLYHT